MRDLSARGVDTGEALRALTAFAVRWACDVLRPVYDTTDGLDGRVSSRWTPGWPATPRRPSPRRGPTNTPRAPATGRPPPMLLA